MQIYQLVSGVIQHKQNSKQWIESLVYAVGNFKCQIQQADASNTSRCKLNSLSTNL
jgi:hypothetical protein